MGSGARERMVEAAFALFETQGYDATTVEAIVEAAGVSRSTFFRVVGSKEDVIFPHHDGVQHQIAARLATASADTAELAVSEAAGLVLEHYLAEGDLARARYRLTRSVPALREREVAAMLGYQRLFRDDVRRFAGGPDPDLSAELLAAAVVTAHNVVLRRWLRGAIDAHHARRALGEAMLQVFASTPALRAGGSAPSGSAALSGKGNGTGTTVVVLRSEHDLDDLLPQLRRALGDPAS